MGSIKRLLLCFWILAALVLFWIPAVSAGNNDMPGPVITDIPTDEPTESPTVTVVVGGGKGWIDTYCNIDGASVYFDGTYQGKTAGGILSVGVSPTGTPVTTIRVSKSGYNSWAGSLSRMPEDGQHVAVYATLNPVTTTPTPYPPDTGAIYTKSSPGGAAIYANGIFYGYAPLTIPSLTPGSYAMKAMLSGYTPDSQTITVYAGQTSSYYPALQPSPTPPRATGTVYLRSSPAGASAYVDGDYSGSTPLTVSLYTGNHDIMFRLPGYSDWTTTVYVTADSSQTLNPSLSPATSGMLTLGSAPSGAQLYLDSNLAGKTNSAGGFTLNAVPGGNHVIKVTAQGYSDWIETVYIQPNTNNYVQISMTPSGTAPVAPSGTIQIVSSPAGAEVSIDNIFRGYTPVTLPQIDAGQHTLTLKLSGYLDYVSTVSVTAGQTTPVAVTMTPAPTPTPGSGLSALIPLGSIAAVAVFYCLIRRRI